MLRDRLENARVVRDAELVRDREEDCVGRPHRLVRGQLCGDLARLADICPAEPGPHTLEQPDLRGPLRGRAGTGSPPDPLGQARRLRLDDQATADSGAFRVGPGDSR
jgi:hypothetical protein